MAVRADGRLAFAVSRDVERVPFALGGTVIVLFAVQVVTGLLLAARYVPTAAGAPESVGLITQAVAYGWFVRGVHRAASTLMIAAVLETVLMRSGLTLLSSGMISRRTMFLR